MAQERRITKKFISYNDLITLIQNSTISGILSGVNNNNIMSVEVGAYDKTRLDSNGLVITLGEVPVGNVLTP
jgi:hypothetical protein